MPNKRKSHRIRKRHVINNKVVIPIKPSCQIKPKPNKTILHKFYLTEVDRETYCYEVDTKRVIQKVVDVSYDIYVRNQWITIIRYDSKHGYLHRHMRVSLKNSSDTPTTAGVIKKGKPKTWLSWARRDISNNFLNYRTGFFRRSEIKNLY